MLDSLYRIALKYNVQRRRQVDADAENHDSVVGVYEVLTVTGDSI